MLPEDVRPDGELMADLARGDCAPLGALYVRYGKMIRAVVSRYAPHLASLEAEDVCQEVFLAVLEAAPRYRDTGKLRAWLCGIAVRKAKELRRKRWLRRALLGRFGRESTAGFDSGPEGAGAARLDIERALRALPEAQREVLVLFTVDRLESDEIAEALGISVNTVWTRLHRARAAMRAALGDSAPAAGGQRP